MVGSHSIDVSIIIVNYNVKHFLEQCLRSIYLSAHNLNLEIFVVDNNSTDGSLEYLKPRFPEVHFIKNTQNVGFARANNQALRLAQGRYILILNPDTLLKQDSLQALIEYMDAHPRSGACGPKMLDRYGKFDKTSKRGFPTPWVAFCRLSGISKLFPHSPLFSRYDLLYIDENTPAIIDALTGSCMMIRREAYLQTGGFDEDFFMYGEDIDWCYRIQQAGWEIHYAPVTKIIHFRGESTRRSDIDRERAFYGAMQIFIKKHFYKKNPWLTKCFLATGIFLAEFIARVSRWQRKLTWPSLDLIGMWLIFVLGRYVRWGAVGLDTAVAFSLFVQSLTIVLCLSIFGAYSKNRGNLRALFYGIGLGFFINSSFTFFFKQFAYSRFVTLFGLFVGGAYILGWRFIIKLVRSSSLYKRFYMRAALIIGVGETGREVVKRFKQNPSLPYKPIGFIDPSEKAVGSIIEDLPVLGSGADLDRLVEQEYIEELLFALDKLDYNQIFELVGMINHRRKVNFKVITPEALKDIPIPQLSLELLTPRPAMSSIRKISSLIIK